MAVAEDLQRGAFGLVIVGGRLIEVLAQDRVGADREALTNFQFFLNVLIEGGAGNSHENQHHGEVDHVAAVAPRIAHGKFTNRRQQI